MAKSTDTFPWTSKLQCPSTICNDSVKSILCSGFVGLLWDDLADVIYSAQEAQTIRKNILLHHLKLGTSNKVVRCKKNILKLKAEKNDLKNEISKLEEEYERQDFLVRQKVERQRELSSKRSETRNKRDILKMKRDETATQLRDCNDMRLVCQHLMPATRKDLDPKTLVEMSDTVITLCTGANKKNAWNLISSNLGNIEIPTLWLHIYQSLTDDVNALIMSEIAKPVSTDEKGVNLGIARTYGHHIRMVSKQLIHKARANNYQQNVVEFIEKIETTSEDADVSEWLALALEVRKLETEQTSLQEEIEKICENLYENNTVAIDLAQLTSEIEYIDTEITICIQDIQRSLSLLKSAPAFLVKTKEKIHLELQRILAMRADGYDPTAQLKNVLTTELDIFYDILDLHALRKVMLKGDIGVYRHVKSCFSEASVSVSTCRVSHVTLYFPFVQTPIYSLIECYKNLISTFAYKKFESLEIEDDVNPVRPSKINFMFPSQTCQQNDVLELLNSSKVVVGTRARGEINEFNELLNAWVNQTVQKVMEIIEKTVDDATFPEWAERYDLILYMLQSSS